MTNHYDDILQREIVTTRILDAPVEMVYAAWADAEQRKLWWGPNGFTTTNHECEFKVGGFWRYTMHGPNGVDYPNEMRFEEIVPNARIVMQHTVPPPFRATVLFEELRGKTKITFRQLFETAQVRVSIQALAGPGNEELLDKFAAELAKKA